MRKVKSRVKSQSLNENDEYTNKMANMLWGLTFVTLMIFNFFAVLGFLWLDVALIVGALSIAIWFAMETTIKNMISGIFLLTNKKNKMGDTVEILGAYQLRGTIESITLRHTIIRVITNQKFIIPNGALADTPIKTFKSEPLMRGILKLKVPRYVNLEQVKKLIVQSINNHNFVLHKEYTSTLISWFDAHGTSISTFYYLNPGAGKTDFVINSEVRTQLSSLFKKYGIKAPYLNVVVGVD